MTANQWLMRGRYMAVEIMDLIRQRRDLYDKLTHCTVSYESDVLTASPDPHKFDAIAEIDETINKKLADLICINEEISSVAEKLQNPKERIIIERYYVARATGKEIAKEIGFSHRYTMKLKNAATQHIEEMISSDITSCVHTGFMV